MHPLAGPRFCDGEVPLAIRSTLPAPLLLSPALGARTRRWRKAAATVQYACEARRCDVAHVVVDLATPAQRVQHISYRKSDHPSFGRSECQALLRTVLSRPHLRKTITQRGLT